MKNKLLHHVSWLLSLSLCGPALLAQDTAGGMMNTFKRSQRPVVFTENKGQVGDQHNRPRPDVLFSGEAGGMIYHLKRNGVSYQLSHVDQPEKGGADLESLHSGINTLRATTTIYRTDIEWLGVNPAAIIKRGKLCEGLVNYYNPVCQEGVTGVRSFESIIYENIYPGIDMEWYGHEHEHEHVLEYDFRVAPQSDYKQIRYKVSGAEDIRINKDGELIIQTPLGEIKEHAPLVYQEGKRIKAKWVLRGNEISFRLGTYDQSLPLLIDPIVAVREWGTYYGGSGFEFGVYAQVDPVGNVYLAGTTNSTSSIATSGSHQASLSGGYHDAFLAKFDSSGVRQWATYYGGNDIDEGGSCSLDAASNIYLAGQASSTTAIATSGSHQPFYAGGPADAFIVKFDNNGIRQWGTYLGGNNWDFSQYCTTDSFGNAFLIGSTMSAAGISTPTSYQPALGGIRDGFAAKFDGNGTLLWSTYFGGPASEYIRSGATDATGNLFLVGNSSSSAGIATPGSYQSVLNGAEDAILVKFDSSGVLQWGTYFGGPGNEDAFGCTVDSDSNVYLVGKTNSASGISTPGSHQPTYQGGGDAFVAKFSNAGNRKWSTYFGGSSIDGAVDCKTDEDNTLYVTGNTGSSSGISSFGCHQQTLAGQNDVYLAKLDSAGNLQWCTYYGGTSDDFSFSCGVDAANMVYLAGAGFSASSIATPGSHQTTYGGGSYDNFLVKFRQCRLDTITISEIVCDQLVSPSGKYVWTSSGVYQDTLVNTYNCDSIITVKLTLRNTNTLITDTTCYSYVSPSGKYTYTATGVYLDTLPNSAGCDSIITLDLLINTVNTGIIKEGNTFTAQQSGAVYQWLDCDSNMKPISGAVFQGFTAISNGRYAVVVAQDGCADTSACYTVSTIGVEQNTGQGSFQLYPNPTSGEVTVKWAITASAMIELLNLQGQSLNKWVFEEKESASIRIVQSAGAYVLRVRVGQDTAMLPLLIE